MMTVLVSLYAIDSLNMRRIGSLYGTALLTDTVRDALFVGDYRSLSVRDLLGHTLSSTHDSLLGQVSDMELVSTTLLSVGLDGYLVIYDVSDLTSPYRLGYLIAPLRGFPRLAVYDTIAYVTDSNRLLVVSFSNPYYPRVVRTITYPAVVRDVARDGSVLAVATLDSIKLYSVAYPSFPSEIGAIPQGAGIIDISRGYLYALTSDGIIIFNITDPSAPYPVDTVSTFLNPVFLKVKGNRMVFLSAGYGDEAWVDVYDVSDPTDVRELGFYWDYGYSVFPGVGADLAGNYVYVVGPLPGIYELLLPTPIRERDITYTPFGVAYDPSGRKVGPINRARGKYLLKSGGGYRLLLVR